MWLTARKSTRKIEALGTAAVLSFAAKRQEKKESKGGDARIQVTRGAPERSSEKTQKFRGRENGVENGKGSK